MDTCIWCAVKFYTANMQVSLNSTNPSFLYFSPLYDNKQPSVESDFGDGLDTLKCTDHMCPIRVHWHVKTYYLTHWRVKFTITNYNSMKNYSNWNLLVQYPGLSEETRTYSFNSIMLHARFRGTLLFVQ